MFINLNLFSRWKNFFLVLSFFFFNLDSSFAANAADIVEENTVAVSENVQNTESALSTNKNVKSIKKVKRDTVIVIVFDDGTVVIIVVRD